MTRSKTSTTRTRRAGEGYSPVETRNSLLASALGLFERRGYPATSVEDIVTGAGLTKGAFYHHFGSKEEVLQIIHDTYIDKELEVVEQILADFDDPRDRLRELIRTSVEDLGEYRSHISVYMQDRRYLTGDRRKAVSAKREAIDKAFRSAIEDGVERGYFRADVTPRLTGLGIIGMCGWVIQWWRPEGSPELAQIADEYSRVILTGLAADGAPD